MKLNIIIPVFNERENIIKVITEIRDIIQKIPEVDNYDFIIVDDHSDDNIIGLVKSLNDGHIQCLRLSRRSGSHVALRAGLTVSDCDVALCIAGDGQDDPSVLPGMMQKLIEGNHVVWAHRNQRNEPIINKIFSHWFYQILIKFSTHMRSKINLDLADFLILDRKILNALKACPEKNTSLTGLILWLGFKQDFVYYQRRNRLSGKSKWNLNTKFKLAKDWIIAFSGIPLKIISIIGLIFALIGFTYAIVIFAFALAGKATSGWTETTILILVIGGIQLTALGVIGEYLWRNFDETRKRPIYFIEDKTTDKEIL